MPLSAAGWSRNASVGLVGVAKQDADRGMKVVNAYLATKEGFTAGEMEAKIETILAELQKKGASVVGRRGTPRRGRTRRNPQETNLGF